MASNKVTFGTVRELAEAKNHWHAAEMHVVALQEVLEDIAKTGDNRSRQLARQALRMEHEPVRDTDERNR